MLCVKLFNDAPFFKHLGFNTVVWVVLHSRTVFETSICFPLNHNF